MHYCMYTLLFKTMLFNYFIDILRNISNIALKSEFNVSFIYSFKNKKRYYIVTSSKDNNKTQIKV